VTNSIKKSQKKLEQKHPETTRTYSYYFFEDRGKFFFNSKQLISLTKYEFQKFQIGQIK